MHIEHSGGSEAQRLQNAVRGLRVVTGGKRERVRHHVGVEADRPGNSPTAFSVAVGKLAPLPLGGERRNTLATDRAHRIAKFVSSSDG